MAKMPSKGPAGPVNAFAAMATKSAGRGMSQRSAAGPREDAADQAGDGMRPMKPSPVSPPNNGRGHMGSFADRMHPLKGRR